MDRTSGGEPALVEYDVSDAKGEGIRCRRWAADRDTFVVGLLSEPPGWGDAQAAMIAVSLVDLTGRRVKLVVHPGGQHGWLTMIWDIRKFADWFDQHL